MVHVVINRYFSLFLKGFEDFSLPEAITDSLLNMPLSAMIKKSCFFFLSKAWDILILYIQIPLAGYVDLM